MKGEAIKDLSVLLFASDWFLELSNNLHCMRGVKREELVKVSAYAKEIVKRLKNSTPTFWSLSFSEERRSRTFDEFVGVVSRTNLALSKEIENLASFTEADLDSLWAFVSVVPFLLEDGELWNGSEQSALIEAFLTNGNAIPLASGWDNEIGKWIGDPSTLIEDFYCVQFRGFDMAGLFYVLVQSKDDAKKMQIWEMLESWAGGIGFRGSKARDLKHVCAKAGALRIKLGHN